MINAVVLDSGPLSLLVHPKGSKESIKCTEWLIFILKNGLNVYIPEIIDYELRCKFRSRLDTLSVFDWTPIPEITGHRNSVKMFRYFRNVFTGRN